MYYIFDLQLNTYKEGFKNECSNTLYKDFTRYMRENLLEDSAARDCLYIDDVALWDLFEFSIVPDLSSLVLKDDESSIMGRTFPNETAGDFLYKLADREKRQFDNLEAFNTVLSICGILPITTDNYDSNISNGAYEMAFDTLCMNSL